METMSSSSSLSIPQELPSTYDELSMHQTLLFSDSLKELRNLRSQLYSAAEYFELSYNNDDQKKLVIDTLKDYAVRALVNTVDHLGSVTHKVNCMLDERVNEVSAAELRVSCIQQRLRTCQNSIDHEGFSQQSLIIATPKHHKRYILPAGETMRGSVRTRHQCCSLEDEDHWHQLKNAILSTIRDTQSTSVRQEVSQSPSPQPSNQPETFNFTEKQVISEKQTVSPSRSRLPLIRSGSFSSRPTTPLSSRSSTPARSNTLSRSSTPARSNTLSRSSTPARSNTPSRSSTPSRPTTQSSPNIRHQISTEQWKSASMRLHGERDNRQEIEIHPSKSKGLFKTLLNLRKSKKDEALYTFLDEY